MEILEVHLQKLFENQDVNSSDFDKIFDFESGCNLVNEIVTDGSVFVSEADAFSDYFSGESAQYLVENATEFKTRIESLR